MNLHAFLADPALALREAAAFGEVLISERGRTVAALVAPRRHPPPVGPRCDPEEHCAGAKGPPS